MSLELRESISLFIDEELDADDCGALIKRLNGNEAQKRVFDRYCIVNDAIKRNLPENLNHDLVARVQVALKSEPVFIAPVEKKPIESNSLAADIVLLPQRDGKQSSFKPAAFGFSIAASMAIVAVLGFQVFTGNEDVLQGAPVAASIEPSTQQIFISTKPVESSSIATLVTDELPLLDAGSGSESATFAEQSVIDDGEWTRITRVGDIPLRNYSIFSGVETHVLFDFQRNASPLVRSVNLDSLPSE